MDKNNILIKLSESPKTSFGKQDFGAQSKPQKIFSTNWSVESEVNNGGFSQYFMNTSAETVPFVVDPLETIGAPTTADICKRAIAVAFPRGLPATGGDFLDCSGFSGRNVGAVGTVGSRVFYLSTRSDRVALRICICASGRIRNGGQSGFDLALASLRV